VSALAAARPLPPTASAPAPRATRWTSVRIFGLDAVELHDLHWLARGMRPVRQGAAADIEPAIGAYLLLEARHLVVCDLPTVASARRPATLVQARIRELGEEAYTERAEADERDRLIAIRRRYRPKILRETEAYITHDAALARQWRDAPDLRTARAEVRRACGPTGRMTCVETTGRVFDAPAALQSHDLLLELLRAATIPALPDGELVRRGEQVIAHRSARISPRARLIGPAWIGAGQVVLDDDVVVGPCVLEDLQDIDTGGIRNAVALMVAPAAPPAAPARRTGLVLERLGNVLLSLAALALTLPLYPLIMLLIWLEDGRPFFFAHERQTLGGRPFRCLKFRTMCRDAEQRKAALRPLNASDGPQFHVPDDPRLLRVGRWMRRLHLDELPQFFNVLSGDMNVVGPRPSPDAENQCCPAWREARLSVRPGITGLWQVCRTRRPHVDFQEWVRFDLQYVSRRTWRLDLWIIWRTIRLLLPF